MPNGLEQLMPGLTGAPSVHPLLVHFPIALVPLALAFHVLALLTDRDALFAAARYTLYAAALASAAAIASGYLAADALGHESPGHDLVHTHRDWMLAFGGVLGASVIFAWTLGDRWRKTLLALLLASSAVLVLGADRGAALVFRYGMGVKHEAPPHTDDHAHEHQHEHD